MNNSDNSDVVSKYLVLSDDAFKYLNVDNTSITPLYKTTHNNLLFRILRKICLKFNIFSSIFLGNWFKKKQYKNIILFDTGNAQYIINILKYRYPSSRIILWYWNPIIKSIPLEKIDKKKCEVWSYSPLDCNKYNLRENTQFFAFPSKRIEIDPQIVNDVYFVGVDKNRSLLLSKLKTLFLKQGISFKFVLVRYKKSNSNGITYSKPISYQESLQNLKESKCVLDIVDNTQKSATTLRVFEAYFYKKKLITNDSSIVNLKIYHPSNIFILGKDDIENIKQFIHSDFTEIRSFNLKYYDYYSWLNRFEIKK